MTEVLREWKDSPISIARFWEMRSAISASLREKLATLPVEQAEQIGLEVQERVREFFPDGQMNFPAEMLIVSASKATDANPITLGNRSV